MRPQQLAQGGEVEPVVEALPVRLEDDREAPEPAGHLQQGGGLEALLPQRRAPAGPAAGDEERPGGVLAEAGAEQRRAAELADDQLLELVRVDQERPRPRAARRRRAGGTAMPSSPQMTWASDPVASRRRAPAGPGPTARARAPPNGRQHAQAPVADLVAEALDHHRGVARHGAGGRRLVLRGRPPGCARPARRRRSRGAGARGRLVRRRGDQLAGQPADGRAELGRAPDALALPERHRAGGARAPARPGRGRAVISSMRQVEAPSMNVWPFRAS